MRLAISWVYCEPKSRMRICSAMRKNRGQGRVKKAWKENNLQIPAVALYSNDTQQILRRGSLTQPQ